MTKKYIPVTYSKKFIIKLARILVLDNFLILYYLGTYISNLVNFCKMSFIFLLYLSNINFFIFLYQFDFDVSFTITY